MDKFSSDQCELLFKLFTKPQKRIEQYGVPESDMVNRDIRQTWTIRTMFKLHKLPTEI